MAYAIHIEQFDGPLDLLLHLITEASLDIKDIFVSEITSQYLAYLSEIDRLDMDSASEFLNVAATLLYIKSKQLLPKQEETSEEEEADPAEELIRQLQEYRAIKAAGEKLREFENAASESFAKLPEDILLPPREYILSNATAEGLRLAFQAILDRNNAEESAVQKSFRHVRMDTYTVRDRMYRIRSVLKDKGTVDFSELFSEKAEKMELIVTFMALLEMLSHGELHIKQPEPFAPIKISAVSLHEDNSAYDYPEESEE